MSMKYVMIYNDWPERTRRLSAADKGRLVDALMAYARGEDPEPLLQGNEQFLFDDLRLQYDRDREQYERVCHVRAAAAEARWSTRDAQEEKNGALNTPDRAEGTGAARENPLSPVQKQSGGAPLPSRPEWYNRAAQPEAAGTGAGATEHKAPSYFPSSLREGLNAYSSIASRRNAPSAQAVPIGGAYANACKCIANDANASICIANDANACKCIENDANASICIQEEEKEKDKYKYKEKDKYTTTPSTIVPRPVKNEEEEWEYHSSLLDKLRNGTRERAITSAETQGCKGDGTHVERTAGKAKEAGSSSPSPIVSFRVKEEEELKERATDPFGHGTEKAGPADAAKQSGQAHPPLPPVFHDDLIDSIKAMDAPRGEHIAKPAVSSSPSAAVPHWIKEEEHHSSLLEKLRNGSQESATTIAEQQGREGDAIQAERTAGKAKETGSSSPSPIVPFRVKEEELKERESGPFGHGTEKFGQAETATHSGKAHPPLPPVFHDDLIDSIKAMGQEKPAHDDKQEEKSAENRGGTVSASTAGERHTALTAGHEGKTTPATAHERQITPATNHDGYVDSAASYEEKTVPTMAHEGKTASAAKHEGHAVPTAAHEGKTVPDTAHEEHTATITSHEGHATPTTSHEERTAPDAGPEGQAATPADLKEQTAPVAAHEGKSSISDHEEQTVPDASNEGHAATPANHEENAVSTTEHEEKTAAAADQEEKPASTAIPSSFEAWLALSEIALPQDEPPADSVSHTAGPFSPGGTYPDAAPAAALPRNFEELCRAANLPCEAEHQRMAEALARQYLADWLADAMLLAGFERRTANWRYVAGVLRNAKQRGYVSLSLPNRDPAPASYRDASSPFRGPYDPPQPAGCDPGREYGSRRDHDDEEINRVLNRVWRMAMEEAEKEKEGAKARDGG